MKSEWVKMTWRELRDRARGEPPVVLVPLGCVETQGPHTPLGMEFLMADALARAVAGRTDSVALPAVPFGYSGDFAQVPGTIFARPETLAMLYEDIYLSVLRAGFSHVLFLAYHIPNQWIVERIARKIREERGVLCAWVNPGALAATYLTEFFADPARARGHGAEPGLSLMRYLTPDAVNLEGASATPAPADFRGWKMIGGGPVTIEGVPVGMPINWEDLYPESGGFGDPTLGSADIGNRIFERLVAAISRVVIAFRAMDTRAPAAAPPSP
jgi:creatinine amidohydrolase